MRAAVLRRGRMVVADVPEPVPGRGQVLVAVKACGICGSDLHFAHAGAEDLAIRRQMERALSAGGTADIDLDADVFMGHEFVAEVLEPGPDTACLPAGTVVTAFPGLRTPTGMAGILYSNTIHGGFGERMLLTARFLLAVPNGLPEAHAALTEPLAVGLHAANRAEIGAKDGAIVLGAGPVGQAVIAALRMRRVEPIIAADLSETRRNLAVAMGAHEAVDPRIDPPFDAWDRHGREDPPVVFDAVGAPGVLNEAIRTAPRRTRLVIVGTCVGGDVITPYWALAKELDIRFSMAYDRTEFADSLRALGEGEVDVTPLITGHVDLDGVQDAFDSLASPQNHCKVLVTP